MDVLIVDDTPAILQLLELLVGTHGHTITTCEDGESALEVLASKQFPLAILDWELPGIDGTEVARHIRTQPGGGTTYILMATARSSTEDLREALQAGANDYIVKPLDVELFDVRLTIAEEQSRIMAERWENRQQLETTLQRLASSNEDLLSTLNQIPIGSVLCDDDGIVRFISRAAATILELDPNTMQGRHWREVLPFGETERQSLASAAEQSTEERERLSLPLQTASDKSYWMDVVIQDDPRNEHGRIFLFLDMTEVKELRQMLGEKSQFQGIVGKSRPMLTLFQQIQEIAPSDITVLIDGETGSGKEVVARAIHNASHRSEKPFIAVNCAGLTDSLLTSQLFGHVKGAFTGAIRDQKGLFEEADGGTLFLDEIGEISMSMQTALLRTLQEREVLRVGENRPRKVDVRIIAATNRDLDKEVAQGHFRADLMYRIRVGHLRLPPLRERLEDIPLLANLFLARFSATSGRAALQLGNSALRLLTEYAWPGNVRELENAIEVAAVRAQGSYIQRQDLPLSLQQAVVSSETVSTASPATTISLARRRGGEEDRQRILEALTETRGNRKEAAQLLGISRATFYRRLEQLNIEL